MREITVPNDMTINLGYRKLKVLAGRRAYPDEVANSAAMVALWDPEPAPAAASPAPAPTVTKPANAD